MINQFELPQAIEGAGRSITWTVIDFTPLGTSSCPVSEPNFFTCTFASPGARGCSCCLERRPVYCVKVPPLIYDASASGASLPAWHLNGPNVLASELADMLLPGLFLKLEYFAAN
jgi:hypothetical protein